MPIPKKELMKRLDDSRREAGLVKKSYWLTPEQVKKVEEFLLKLKEKT